MTDTTSNPTQLLELIGAGWAAQAIYVAAELNIADLLADGPRTSEDLAAATSTHAPSLRRLLRALTSIGVCDELEDGSFAITPMGSLLGTGPGSLRSWALWTGGHLWDAWGRLLESVSTGESVRKSITGFEGFDRLQIDAESARVFNEAMAELTRLVAEDVAKICDFSNAKQVVDVGGGYGDLLLAILRANPEVSGIIFDLPHAMDGAKRALDSAGLASRCEFRSGSFLEDLPPGADAYLLKSVIHDWDDENAALILRNCNRAMNGKGRVFLIERLLPARMSDSPAHRSSARMDLTMLLVHSGRERTEDEFRRLLAAAGFDLVRIRPTSGAVSVIEARPTE